MNKQLLALLTTIIIVATANAQKITYGIKAGPNISSGRVITSYKTYSGTSLGFHAGGIANIELTKNLTLQPNLLFSLKRANVKDLNGIKISLFTIDLPITLLYKYEKFFGGAGPNLSYGLSSHYKYNGTKYDLYDKNNNGLFGTKRFEFGLNILAGYYITNDLFVSANFTPGLTDLYDHAQYAGSGTKVKTSVIGISIGTTLKGKK